MSIQPSDITDEDLPEPRILTEEESREMKESLAQSDFGMSLAEFTKAWLAGEFDNDRERHVRVIGLAMMMPEYWADSEERELGLVRGNIMPTKPSDTTDEDLPQGRWLTEEEDKEMKENLAQRNFGMSLAEFTEVWKSGAFDGDRERHGNVVFLASMLPEYWADSN